MLAYVLLGLAAISAVSADCSIDMNGDLPKHKSPLFIENGALMTPTPQGKSGVLTLKSGEAVTLACTGKKNTLSAAKKETVDATCSSGSKLVVNGKTTDVKDLGCSKTAGSELKVTDKACDLDGTILELGFEVSSDQWYKMVDLCHEISKGNTLWAKHTVDGKALPGAEVESKRPSFTRGDSKLYKGYDPNNLYKQTTHKKMLANMLGQKLADDLMGKTFIARGHLAPDADFIFGSWQFLTYFYANVAPQWQSINAGNWLATEKNVRTTASNLGRDLTVYTGTQGVLTVDGKELYLEEKEKKVPIPENFWKVLYDGETKKGIALIGSNNPLNGSKQLCKNICAENNWPEYTDIQKGQIYCCSVADFQKAVSYAPKLTVSGVLAGPKKA